jgi:hypothetical protein
MADKKITQLTNITGANLVDADEFVVVDISADETKAITLGELKEAFDSGSGFVRITGDTMTGDLTVPNVVVSGNVDGRDVSADGTKLDGIEAGADVTDTANVGAAGAVMTTAATGQANMPAGTTAQRTGSPVAGALRFNSTDVSFEGYDGTEWGAIGGGGGASEGIFYENEQSLSTNYTIVATKNAMTAGPITINDGVTVTIETGGRWVVL